MKTSAVGARLDAGLVCGWLMAFGEALEEQCDFLTRLDAAIGDADHGINMRRGLRAVLSTLQPASRLLPGELLREAGKRLVFTVGGAAGPLYGTAFRRLGAALPSTEAFGAFELSAGLAAALAGVQELGAAEEGDKTMVDALAPAVRALQEGLAMDRPLSVAVRAAAGAAQQGVAATIPLRALKGRASYLGERSEGHQDPGATSTALLLRALSDVVSA